MMQIYDVATAQATILRRQAWDEFSVPAALLDRIEAIFGAGASP